MCHGLGQINSTKAIIDKSTGHCKGELNLELTESLLLRYVLLLWTLGMSQSLHVQWRIIAVIFTLDSKQCLVVGGLRSCCRTINILIIDNTTDYECRYLH